MKNLGVVHIVASAFVLLAFATGCAEEVSPEPPAVASAEPVASFSFGRPAGAASGSTSARALLETYFAFEKAVEGEDWAAADRRVRALLLAPSEDVPPHTREQVAATLMLDRHLLAAPPSPEALEALGHHTQALIDNRSPEASLVADALNQLQGHWSQARIQASAALAAAVAEKQAGPGAEEAPEREHAASAIARLRALAQ